MALAELREGAAARPALELAVSRQTTFKEFAVRVGRTGARGRSATRAARRPSRATRSAATTPGWTTRCSSPSPRSGRRADIDRLAEVLARSAVKLIYESRRRAAAPVAAAAPRPARARGPAGAARAQSRRACPSSPSRSSFATSPSSSTRNFGIDTGFYPLGSCTMKYNPRVNERVVGLPGFRDLHPLQEEDGAQGALELMWRLQEILARGRRAPRRLASARRRLAGRADRADADARLLRRPRRGRAAAQDRHPRHRARHEPGQRDDGRLRARRRSRPTRAATSTSRTCAARSTSTRPG